MSDFVSKTVAPLVSTDINYNGREYSKSYIGVAIKVDNKALNDIFSSMTKMVMQKEYDILKAAAHGLVDHSPVMTGYFVANWTVNPNSATKTNNNTLVLQSGAARRKLAISASAAEALKLEIYQVMAQRIEDNLALAFSNKNRSLKDSWVFGNPTPYAQKLDSKYGFTEAAKVAAETELGR